MNPIYFSGALLLALLVATAMPRLRALFSAYRAYFFAGAVLLVAMNLAYLSYMQYGVWRDNEFSKFFLPPHQDWSYFFLYVGARFFAPYAISLLAALLFFFSAIFANRRFHERFFSKEEPFLAALSLFLVGHPAWLVYFGLVIVVYLAIQLWSTLRKDELSRIPLYHLWVPLALFVIIIMKWLTAAPLWLLLKV